MMRHVMIMTLSVGVASAVFAHSGVKDPGVKARMHAMKMVGEATKVLRDMASAKRPFEVSVAEDSKAAIMRHLAQSEELFRLPHDDPKTEALPVIWQNYPGFTGALDKAIAAVDALKVGDVAVLRDTLPAAGQGCRDCHRVYRK